MKLAIVEKDDQKFSNLKTYIKPSKSNPKLKQAEVIQYLERLRSKFVIVPIDKAYNNVANI